MSFRLPTLIFLLTAASLSAAPTYREALDLYKAQKYPEARLAFQQLAAEEPANPKYRYFLGMVALRRNDFDEAISQLEQSTVLAPGNSDYFAELGNAYGSAARKAGVLSQLSLAKKCRLALEKAVELNPDSLDARNGLISFYRQAPGFLGGGMPKAYVQAEEIRKRDPIRGALILGQLYASERRFDEAFTVALEHVQLQPESYLAHYTMGRLAAESGQRLDAGEKHLHHCLELTPAKDEPSHAAVHWRLGNIAERRRESAAARTAYETALKLDPNFKQATASLAKLKP
jgi:tetratricopeptide (TPR) repeat protein